MTTHPGYEKPAAEGRGTGNSRNGATGKNILTGSGELEIEVPRDRNGEFDQPLGKKASAGCRASTTRGSRGTRAG